MTKLNTAIIVFLLSAFSLLAERTVTLKKTIQVSGSQVVLSDLLVDSSSLEKAEKNLVILNSPLRGSKNFRPVDIAYEMQQHKSLMDLALLAPSFVKVIRVKDIDFVEKVKEGLIVALGKETPWKMFDLEMELTATDISKISAMSGNDFEVISQRPSDELDSVKITVKFIEKGINKGAVILNPIIRRKILAITLKNSIKRGGIVQKSDLILDRIWVSGTDERYAVNFQDCVGYEVSRNIAAGSRIAKSFLIEPVYVEKGSFLKVYVKSGLLTLSVDAKALSTGRRGETIRVKNTKSGKDLDVIMTGLQTGIVQ